MLHTTIDVDDSGAYRLDGRLYVHSPIDETIQVYSTAGLLLYRFDKPAGTVNHPVDKALSSVLIVKGSSGWAKKVIR